MLLGCWSAVPLWAPGTGHASDVTRNNVQALSCSCIRFPPQLSYTIQPHIPGSGLEPSCRYQISVPRIELFLLTARTCGSFENNILGARKGDIEDVCQAIVS